MKVAVLGNCQAQAIQTWLAMDAPSIEVVTSGPTYMMTEEHREATLALYDSVDYVFQQRVAEDFGAEFLRPSFMKENYRNKYISWPNIYFDGYFPGIRYLYDMQGKVTGPLADYHFDFVIEAFKKQRPVDEVAKIFEDEILQIHPDSVHRSLVNLSEREDGLDIKISDFIAGGLNGPQQFYAMNHPSDMLLREMLERMLGFVSERRKLTTRSSFKYTLDEIQIPTFPAIQTYERVGLGAFDGKIKGKALTLENGRLASDQAKVATYDWTSLVAAYYDVYPTVELF